MNAEKRKRLGKADWKVGTVQELFGLSDEQMQVIYERERRERHKNLKMGRSLNGETSIF